jgi:glucokinase
MRSLRRHLLNDSITSGNAGLWFWYTVPACLHRPGNQSEVLVEPDCGRIFVTIKTLFSGMKRFLGIEIGGTKLQVVSGDEDARIDHRIFYTIDPAEGAAGIRRRIEEALLYWKGERLDGIGVGFGGPVDREKGTAWTSYHIGGWSGFAITEWLEEVSGAPVKIENDANAAALAEALYGAGRNDRIVFYVTLGSGVGGGLVIDRQVYHSLAPGETEFGHLRLDKTGRTLESSCSGWSVNEKIRKAAYAHPDSGLAALAREVPGMEAKILLEAISKGDAYALRIFQDTMDDLAFGLSHVVHLFHPDTIVLGGGLSLIGEPLLKEVSGRLPAYLMDAFQPGPNIRLSALKQDAVPMGSLALARPEP